MVDGFSLSLSNVYMGTNSVTFKSTNS
jgi:hypothetical protein